MESIFRKILVGVLALVGFSGCAPKVEYGVPHANLKVKATVVDQAGNPVGNTRLVLKNSKDNLYLKDFETETDGTVSESLYFTDELDDISEANVVYYKEDNPGFGGKYKDDSVSVKVKKVKAGDGRWYNGDFEMDFILKLKEEDGKDS